MKDYDRIATLRGFPKIKDDLLLGAARGIHPSRARRGLAVWNGKGSR